MIRVTAKVGPLTLLNSGSVTFSREQGVLITVNTIRVQITVPPFIEEDFKVNRKAEPEKLTVNYEFKGTFPFAPFGRFSVAPEKLGTIGGKSILFWWHITRLMAGSDIVELQYAFYIEGDDDT